VLDVDSTLCGIEGIDWLAARRGPDVERAVRELTEQAMTGKLALESVYGRRLETIRPTSADVAGLAVAYRASLAPDAGKVIAELQTAGVRVVLVSGGIRQAIQLLAADLGVELHAVDVTFGPAGEYASFDERSPLVRQDGKADVLRSLSLAQPSLAVGDGATDVFMAGAVDRFVAFTGFARRESVVTQASGEVESFDALRALILSQP